MENRLVVETIASVLHLSQSEALKIYEKAKVGGECTDSNAMFWLEERFLPNILWIDEIGYTKMCIDALKILHTIAATDYGTSRQRDLGQLWGDMTRGYLAEYAFIQWLEQNWGIQAKLDHEKGDVEEYLSSDIYRVYDFDKAHERLTRIRLSVKGTKWNGIWLDIPGAQFHISDIHILVKVGVSRNHLFAYFQHISVFRDKVFKRGIEFGILTPLQADALSAQLPRFTNIPAYICGFAIRDTPYNDLPYGGKKGTIHYTVTSWRGPIFAGDLARIRQRENIKGQIKFEGIGRFSHDSGYLFNTGNLLWQRHDWQKYVIAPL